MKLLAIDVGLKRIGVAYTPDGKMALPLDPIPRKNRNQAAGAVLAAMEAWSAEGLVVGLPKGGSSEEEMERRIRHFVGLLEYEGPVYFQDEYGTSAEAKEMSKGVFRHQKDGKIDSLAAKLILERWLEGGGK